MTNEIYVVIGWTAPIDLELQVDGVVADLTGATAAFTVTDGDGVRLELVGTTTITAVLTGSVRFTPAAGDFSTFGTFGARVKVIYASGAVVFFPAAAPIRLVVGA